VSGTVTKLGATGTMLWSVSAGGTLGGIAIDAQGRGWVSDNANGKLVVLSSSNGSIVGSYTTGIRPYGWIGDFTGYAYRTFVLK
jgi:hypothetical protein